MPRRAISHHKHTQAFVSWCLRVGAGNHQTVCANPGTATPDFAAVYDIVVPITRGVRLQCQQVRPGIWFTEPLPKCHFTLRNARQHLVLQTPGTIADDGLGSLIATAKGAKGSSAPANSSRRMCLTA